MLILRGPRLLSLALVREDNDAVLIAPSSRELVKPPPVSTAPFALRTARLSCAKKPFAFLTPDECNAYLSTRAPTPALAYRGSDNLEFGSAASRRTAISASRIGSSGWTSATRTKGRKRRCGKLAPNGRNAQLGGPYSTLHIWLLSSLTALYRGPEVFWFLR